MGLRFRKTIRLLPGIRVNLSKSGPSLSVGGKGLTENIGRKGTRTTVGLPGTGMSYSRYNKNGGRGFGWVFVLAILAVVYLAFQAGGVSGLKDQLLSDRAQTVTRSAPR